MLSGHQPQVQAIHETHRFRAYREALEALWTEKGLVRQPYLLSLRPADLPSLRTPNPQSLLMDLHRKTILLKCCDKKTDHGLILQMSVIALTMRNPLHLSREEGPRNQRAFLTKLLLL